jgi:hypothetical protein
MMGSIPPLVTYPGPNATRPTAVPPDRGEQRGDPEPAGSVARRHVGRPGPHVGSHAPSEMMRNISVQS